VTKISQEILKACSRNHSGRVLRASFRIVSANSAIDLIQRTEWGCTPGCEWVFVLKLGLRTFLHLFNIAPFDLPHQIAALEEI
jgi:hypothetical protein